MSRSDSPRPHAALSRCMRLTLLALVFHGVTSWASDSATRTATAGVQTASATKPPQHPPAGPPRRADLGQEPASAEAAQLADWVVDSRDNQDMPFLIIDKVNAKVLLFDRSGRLQGAAAALLGLALGDDSTPGIGERRLSTILPAERTTPAGRFVASLDHDARGQELLWVDYNTALALHRVVKGTPSEQRSRRLESVTTADNRISFGCINVPVGFFDKVVSPAFAGTNGVVYILPETRTAREVFGSYDVDEAAQALAPATPAPTPNAASLVQRAVH